MKQPEVWPVLDDYGLQKVPLRFYALLLLLLRPYISWVLVLTLPEAQRDMLRWVYPQQHDFIVSCLVALPVLLMLAALSQRKPKGQRAWRHIWRLGKPLMFIVAFTDLLLTLLHLPAQVMLDAPWRIAVPVLLLLGCCWLVWSKTLRLVFSEWPERATPVKSNSA